MSYFSNTVILVTGAASGIGRQVALLAASRGASVIAADINEQGLELTKTDAAQQGYDIKTYQLDVGDKEAIQQFAAMITPQLANRKLVLVNNAGVALFTGHFQDTELEDIEWLININFWGAVRLTKAFYPYFLERNEGHIVNISSILGIGGLATQAAYASSKFAIRGFTETLRMELIGTGINTTSVHPGGIKTNITRNARAKGPIAPFFTNSIDEFDRVARTTPEKAARLILRAVEKKKQRLLIGNDARVFDWVIRHFPVIYTKLVKKYMDRSFENPYKKQNH